MHDDLSDAVVPLERSQRVIFKHSNDHTIAKRKHILRKI